MMVQRHFPNIVFACEKKRGVALSGFAPRPIPRVLQVSVQTLAFVSTLFIHTHLRTGSRDLALVDV